MRQYSARVGNLYARRIGNWNKTTQFFDELGYSVRDTINQSLRKEMHQFRKKLIYNIMTQAFRGEWAPLSSKYSANKKENKNLIYLNTEKYVNNLVVKYTNQRAYVGFRKGVSYHRPKGRRIPIDLVARWMEYGEGTTPARPLWNPTWNQMGGTAGMEQRIADKVYQKLKKLSSNTGVKIDRSKINRR